MIDSVQDYPEIAIALIKGDERINSYSLLAAVTTLRKPVNFKVAKAALFSKHIGEKKSTIDEIEECITGMHKDREILFSFYRKTNTGLFNIACDCFSKVHIDKYIVFADPRLIQERCKLAEKRNRYDLYNYLSKYLHGEERKLSMRDGYLGDE